MFIYIACAFMFTDRFFTAIHFIFYAIFLHWGPECRPFFAIYIYGTFSFFVSLEHNFLCIHNTFICSATLCACQMICMYFEPWRIKVMIHIKFISDPPSLFPYSCVMQKSKWHCLVHPDVVSIGDLGSYFLPDTYTYILNYLHS